MEDENLRRFDLAGDLDSHAMTCPVGELTRTDSVSSTLSSSLTVQSSKESLTRNANDHKSGKSTEWTDEKHDSYLNFLEETFVNQVKHSMHKCQWHTEKLGWGSYTAHDLSRNASNPINQFMVLQDGRWQKIKYHRDENLVNITTQSNIPIESPWIQHFTSGGKHNLVTCNAKEHGVSSSESTILQEVSDQNFLEENLNAKSIAVHAAKRSRKAAVDTSCTDQVVPSGKRHTTNASTSNTSSIKRKESQKEDLPSDHPEGSVYKKSDIHYFLRGR